jgi:hypothetical protein
MVDRQALPPRGRRGAECEISLAFGDPGIYDCARRGHSFSDSIHHIKRIKAYEYPPSRFHGVLRQRHGLAPSRAGSVAGSIDLPVA